MPIIMFIHRYNEYYFLWPCPICEKILEILPQRTFVLFRRNVRQEIALLIE